MQRQQKPNELPKYLNLLRHRWWMLVLPSLVLGPAVTFYSMGLPDRFRSSTVILVTPQKVPSNFVTSTVTSDIQDRLSTIRQQVLSRTVLEAVIEELKLYPEQRARSTLEEVVGLMRKAIRINVARDGRNANSFEISFEYADARVAMAVTGRLASLFIDENLKAREQQAVGTTQFLSDEIDRYRAEVREKETEIYAFKQKHIQESPEQLTSNQARLAELQNRLQINSQNLNAAKDRKVVLQQQLADIEKRALEDRDRRLAELREAAERARTGAEHGRADRGRAPEPQGPASALEREIERQREELARLRMTHTEKHPDVVRVSASLRRLEQEDAKARQAAGQNAAVGTAAGQPRTGPEPQPVRVQYPPTYDQIKADILRAEADVARIAAENVDVQRLVEIYQTRIAAVPQRELQLRQLSEGYNNVKTVLENLTNNKLQAELASNMEIKQKGEQFKMLDPANLPDKPVAPNRLVFVLGGFLGGAGLGAGVVLLLDRLNRGCRNREELAEAVGLPVFGVIPHIVTPADLQRRRKLLAWGSGVSAAVLVGMALTIHVSVKPLPRAFDDFLVRLQKTHWTTMK